MRRKNVHSALNQAHAPLWPKQEFGNRSQLQLSLRPFSMVIDRQTGNVIVRNIPQQHSSRLFRDIPQFNGIFGGTRRPCASQELLAALIDQSARANIVRHQKPASSARQHSKYEAAAHTLLDFSKTAALLEFTLSAPRIARQRDTQNTQSVLHNCLPPQVLTLKQSVRVCGFGPRLQGSKMMSSMNFNTSMASAAPTTASLVPTVSTSPQPASNRRLQVHSAQGMGISPCNAAMSTVSKVQTHANSHQQHMQRVAVAHQHHGISYNMNCDNSDSHGMHLTRVHQRVGNLKRQCEQAMQRVAKRSKVHDAQQEGVSRPCTTGAHFNAQAVTPVMPVISTMPAPVKIQSQRCVHACINGSVDQSIVGARP